MNEDIRIIDVTTYAGQTVVHPIGLLAVIILGLLVLILPRKWSVLPILIMACFVSSAQRIVVAGLDFDFLRIMVFFGIIRVYSKKESSRFMWISLDTGIILWMLSSMLFYILQQHTFNAVVNRLGFAFDVLGMYFLFRFLIRDWIDIEYILYGIILISIPVAVFFLFENQTGRNLFSIFGGVPHITEIREGRLRCQGAFSHPILAGCFWVSLLPIFASFWWKSAKQRAWVITGFITSSIIVICCASSTPVMGVISAVIGGLFFYFRYRMRLIRWLVLLALVALHMVMNNPVWHLISRFSAVGGSTSWHRYNVINETINHFDEWFLCGCSGYTVAGWGIYNGDVTNQYVLEGIRGGFLTLCLFVLVLVFAFRNIGRLWRQNTQDAYHLALSWALGVSLYVHCVNFIGVSYFGQIQIIWYLLLAMIGSLSEKLSLVRIPCKKVVLNVNRTRHQQNDPLVRELYHVS